MRRVGIIQHSFKELNVRQIALKFIERSTATAPGTVEDKGEDLPTMWMQIIIVLVAGMDGDFPGVSRMPFEMEGRQDLNPHP
jgi:hypothetical protein